MRCIQLLGLLLFVASCTSPVLAEQNEISALEARVAELERTIAALQQELDAVREKLAALAPARPLTPLGAVEQFRRYPDKPVTVEFGVERIIFEPAAEDADADIIATWDNYFHGGGTMSAILPPRVYRQLMLPTKDGKTVKLQVGSERQQVARHIETNGIRVTGMLQAGEGFSESDYVIRVEDPANVELYIKGTSVR